MLKIDHVIKKAGVLFPVAQAFCVHDFQNVPRIGQQSILAMHMLNPGVLRSKIMSATDSIGYE